MFVWDCQMYSIKDKTMHKPKKSKDTAISSNKNFLKKKKENRNIPKW